MMIICWGCPGKSRNSVSLPVFYSYITRKWSFFDTIFVKHDVSSSHYNLMVHQILAFCRFHHLFLCILVSIYVCVSAHTQRNYWFFFSNWRHDEHFLYRLYHLGAAENFKAFIIVVYISFPWRHCIVYNRIKFHQYMSEPYYFFTLWWFQTRCLGQHPVVFIKQ